ncbi:hypothetical protein HYU22_02860 [Candidatus Woesearchaeota archaeon]|nr:hypothetical protein [Candidatus Woesearchaeota archaeon]
MSRKIIWSGLFLLLSYTTLAADLPADFQAGLADAALPPLLDSLQPLLQKLSLIVGGIFGLYIILILVRIHYERKTLKTLQDIRYDLDHLNMHYNLPASRDQPGLWKRMFSSVISPFRHTGEEEKKKKPK